MTIFFDENLQIIKIEHKIDCPLLFNEKSQETFKLVSSKFPNNKFKLLINKSELWSRWEEVCKNLKTQWSNCDNNVTSNNEKLFWNSTVNSNFRAGALWENVFALRFIYGNCKMRARYAFNKIKILV